MMRKRNICNKIIQTMPKISQKMQPTKQSLAKTQKIKILSVGMTKILQIIDETNMDDRRKQMLMWTNGKSGTTESLTRP